MAKAIKKNDGNMQKDAGSKMNSDVFKGKWMQFRGRIKQWWGDVTDDDLDRIEGRWDRFVGMLQEKYGYTQERAEEEANRRWREFEGEFSGSMSH